MRQIYAKATRVLIWLGPDEDGNAALAADMAKLVCNEMCMASKMTLADIAHCQMEALDDILQTLDGAQVPSGDLDVWRPFAWLVSRAWFKRIWVIQEATSARDIHVTCGDVDISWNTLGLTAMWVQKQIMRTDFADFKMFEHSSVYEASELYDRDYSQRSDWIEILHAYRSLDSTDPRDKVFALLGLVPFDHVSKQSLRPDYTESKLDVYTRVAETALQDHKSLRMLSYVQHGPELEQNWPSWVPRWDISLDVAGFDSQVEGFAFSASDEIKLNDIGWSIENKRLTVKGIPFATTDYVGDMMRQENFHLAEKMPCLSHPITLFFTEKVSELRGARITEQIAWMCFGLTAGLNIEYERAFLTLENWEQHAADFAAYMKRLVGPRDSITDLLELLDPNGRGDSRRYEVAASRACDQRRIFLTTEGFIGLGPAAMRSGDRICILFGGQQPVVLRPSGTDHRFVGECYMNDIMLGEAVRDYKSGKQVAEEFHLC